MTKLQYLIQSVDNDWYTPKKYIESAKKVFDGEIHFDPFSCHEANLLIQAKSYFTKNDDAFLLDWPKAKSVWCNPPYERGLINKSVDTVITYASNMDVDTQIIMVVNSSTDTSWYQKLLKHSSAMCFTNHRIKFIYANSRASTGNTRGQTFFYFGNDSCNFKLHFEQYGVVISKDKCNG
jgi:16S rRNA G966 N2-methylase RsmD